MRTLRNNASRNASWSLRALRAWCRKKQLVQMTTSVGDSHPDGRSARSRPMLHLLNASCLMKSTSSAVPPKHTSQALVEPRGFFDSSFCGRIDMRHFATPRYRHFNLMFCLPFSFCSLFGPPQLVFIFFFLFCRMVGSENL